MSQLRKGGNMSASEKADEFYKMIKDSKMTSELREKVEKILDRVYGYGTADGGISLPTDMSPRDGTNEILALIEPLNTENERLRDEVARLNGTHIKMPHCAFVDVREIDRLKAENEELRRKLNEKV